LTNKLYLIQAARNNQQPKEIAAVIDERVHCVEELASVRNRPRARFDDGSIR
jgi:hypothetical protein